MAEGVSQPPAPVYSRFVDTFEEAPVTPRNADGYDNKTAEVNQTIDRQPLDLVEKLPIDCLDASPCAPRSEREQFKVYPTRWYILALFAVLGIWQNLVYSTFGPIATSATFALELTQTDLALLPNWYNIAYVLSAFPYVWLVEEKGLRMPMTATMGFVAVGTAIRCLHTGNLAFDKIFLHMGQLINGFGAAVPWFGCTHISAVWFPPEQRNLATAIGLFASGLGVSFAFVLGPAFVNAYAGSGTQEEIYNGIYHLFYFEAIVCNALLFLTVFYFPSKPPTPPSFSAKIVRVAYLDGFKRFFTNPMGLLMLAVYSTNTIFGSWNQFLAVTVQGVMSETECGWLGFTMTVVPIVLGPPFAALLALKPIAPKSRNISIVLVAVACCFLVVFVLAANIPSMHYLLTKPLIWGTIVPGITFATSAQPVWWELCCDAVFPVPESIVSGIFSVGSCTVSLVFLVILMFPALGWSWIHWVLLIAQASIVPMLLCYRHSGKRSEADRLQRHDDDLNDNGNSDAASNIGVNTSSDQARLVYDI